MKRKGSVEILAGAAILVFIAMLFVLHTLNGSLPWSEPGEIVTIDGKACELIRPLFGNLACSPLPEKINDYSGSFAQGYWKGNDYVSIPANAPSADVIVRCWDSYEFTYQKDGLAKCFPGANEWCTVNVGANEFYDTGIRIEQGQRLRVGGCSQLYGAWSGFPGEVYLTYTPYGLVRTSSGAKVDIVNAGECSIFSEPKLVKDCGDAQNCAADKTSSGLGNVFTTPGELTFGDWVNYLDFYVTVPKIGNVQDYNGKDVVCIADGSKVALWELGAFETDGSCYYVEKTKVALKDCCNGDTYPGYVCQNWVWVPGQSTGCISSLECTNSGDWYTSPTNPNLMQREECVNAACEVVETKNKGCSSSSDCPTGYVCNLQTYQCVKSVPQVVCGDGICSTPYESFANCPVDCTNAFNFDWNLLWIIAIALLGAAIGYLGAAEIGALIGSIIGGVIGYAIYWYMSLNWWSQLLLAIGGIAGGGIMLYLFGGAIASFIILLILVLRKD